MLRIVYFFHHEEHEGPEENINICLEGMGGASAKRMSVLVFGQRGT